MIQENSNQKSENKIEIANVMYDCVFKENITYQGHEDILINLLNSMYNFDDNPNGFRIRRVIFNFDDKSTATKKYFDAIFTCVVATRDEDTEDLSQIRSIIYRNDSTNIEPYFFNIGIRNPNPYSSIDHSYNYQYGIIAAHKECEMHDEFRVLSAPYTYVLSFLPFHLTDDEYSFIAPEDPIIYVMPGIFSKATFEKGNLKVNKPDNIVEGSLQIYVQLPNIKPNCDEYPCRDLWLNFFKEAYDNFGKSSYVVNLDSYKSNPHIIELIKSLSKYLINNREKIEQEIKITPPLVQNSNSKK